MLVVPHTLIATFIVGMTLIAPVSEYIGLVSKEPRYDRFARNAAKFLILLFASGSAMAFTFFFALVTLYPVFFTYLMNIFFWVFLAEAFMFIGEVLLVYAWYNAWDRMAYRKRLHVIFGFMGGLFGLVQMTLINVVGSYMMTPSEAPATSVGWTYLNPTYMALNMHRFVGNLSYVGFLIAGWAAWRYLRSLREDEREYYDWMGHWGMIWGFGFMILQPVIGYGYMKAIREHSPVTFEYLMKGDKAWLFNLLMIELSIMAVASIAYFLHKMNFARKPMPTLRGLTLGALGFMGILTALLMIPADADLVPQLGLVFLEGEKTSIPLGSMYPWKYIGLIGLMLVGIFAVALYLKISANGFHWGRASRWSQYALLAASVTVVLTMMTMGYARETGRRAGDDNWLIRECITFDQQVIGSGCPEAPKDNP